MTELTEGKRPFEFEVSRANGTRSFETATVVSGQNLVAGQLVQDNGSGKLTAYTGTSNTAGDLITNALGILCANVDASAGDVTGAVYLARDAEVNLDELTFPAEATDESGNAVASLKLLGIIAR